MITDDVGARISEARKHRGLSQVDLANAVGIERTALVKIENGQRRVTAVELSDLARELHHRMEWFILPRPVSAAQHRGATGALASFEIDVALEQAATDVMLLRELGLLVVPPRPEVFQFPGDGQGAEDLAATARSLMGLTADEAWAADSARPLSIGMLTFAVSVENRPDGSTEAHAASLTEPGFGVAVVNSSMAVGRRRLALAHEIGHFLVDDRYTTDLAVGDDSNPDLRETRLDRFARGVLLPSSIAKQWTAMESQHGVREAAVRLASAYSVDMSTLARRLVELDAISSSTATEVRQVRTTKADIIEYDLRVSYDLEGTFVDPAFAKAVLRAYRAEDISEARALSMLRGTLDELPELPPHDESHLWTLLK